jgi:hypothetical protein
MEIINWRIAKHPLNWVTLFLFVFIAGIAFHFILTLLGKSPTPVAS